MFKIVASDGEPGDLFGHSVALADYNCIVGAPMGSSIGNVVVGISAIEDQALILLSAQEGPILLYLPMKVLLGVNILSYYLLMVPLMIGLVAPPPCIHPYW